MNSHALSTCLRQVNLYIELQNFIIKLLDLKVDELKSKKKLIINLYFRTCLFCLEFKLEYKFSL